MQCVVPMNKTTLDLVGQPPVVFIHPIGGHLHWYRAIASELTGCQLYGIQSPTISTLSDQYTSVSEMASAYLQALESVDVSMNGLTLVGWSFGCHVALEMAQQHRASQGDMHLVLLDPQQPKARDEDLESGFLNLLSREYNLHLHNHVNDHEDIMRLLENWMSYLDINALAEGDSFKGELYTRNLTVLTNNIKAFLSYEFKSIQNPLTLIYPETQYSASSETMSITASLDFMLGLCSSRPDSYTFSGDHYQLLEQASAVRVASKIRELIQEPVC